MHLLVLLYDISSHPTQDGLALTNMLDNIMSSERRLEFLYLLLTNIDNNKWHDCTLARYVTLSVESDILLECLLLSLTIFAPLDSNSLTALFLSSSEVDFWNETITEL